MLVVLVTVPSLLFGDATQRSNAIAGLGFMSPFLIAAIGLIIFFTLSTKPLPKSDKARVKGKKLEWLLSRLTMISLIVSMVVADNAARSYPYSSRTSVLENTSAGAVIVAGLLAVILIGLQRGAYGVWMFATDTSKLDERQARIRQVVFERAYSALLMAVLLGTWFFDIGHSITRNAGIGCVVVLAIAMPSIVAAGRKDA
jgi:hypothetical protein